MNLFKKNKFSHRIVSGILCLVLAMTTFLGIGSQTAKAAISPLITSYKPQVVSSDTNVSYTDSSWNTVSGTIHHPGIAMSQTDLDNMRDHVRAGGDPWNTAFNAFASDSQSSKNARKYYEAGNDIFINIRGPWGEEVNGVWYDNPSEYATTRGNTDAETAFHQAIMWYITGDEVYRSKAMEIIRDYSNIVSVVEHTNFRLATMTYLLAAAAEILRYSDTPTASLKWTETDTQKLVNMMNLSTITYNTHTFFMNQHQFTVMGTMARAIFTNDLELYAEAVEATTVNAAGNDGGRNGSVKHQMRWMMKNEMTGEPLDPSDYHVQLIEMGRDQGHTYADIAGLSTLAQTIYAQGTKVDPVDGTMSTAANAVNAFNFLNDRLLEGTTYALKYHLGYEVLWTPAWANHGSVQYYESINPWPGRGRFDPYLSVLYNYYKYIEGRDMTQEKYKYLAYAYETRMPEVPGKDYPLATLLYTPDAAKADGLSNRIILGGIMDLSATVAGSDSISLSWTAVSGSLGYNIYRSTEENGTYTKITSEPVTTASSYSDTGLTPNTIYYYKVGVSGGSTSGIVSATTGGTGVPAFDVSYYELYVNHTHQSVLRVIKADRSSQDLTSQASFTSSNPAVATVDSAGLVTGAGVGTATITATYNGQAYHATVKAIIDTQLIARYKMDETSGATAADSSGNGNNGTLNGGAAWTAGQSGNAVDLDGTDDYMALPAVVSGADTVTVAAWVNLDTVSNWMRIFDLVSEASTYMFLTPQNGSTGKIRFGIRNKGSTTQNIDGTSALTTGGWHHMTVTLNGSTGTLYVDGSAVGSNTSMTIKPSDMGATTQNWIGRSQHSEPYLDGRVDDFRIYNRAISSSEVASVMNGQSLVTVTTAPSGLTAATADHSSININWSAVTGTAGYNVYIADSLAANAIYTKANSELITGTTFASLGLKANSTYYYKVTAVNARGESSMSAIASATTDRMLNANLISWFKFDQTSGTTAADASGYGNNGTINGGAAGTAGIYGGAVELDGTNDSITIPAGDVSSSDALSTLDSITVATWVNWNGGNAWQRIFDFGNSTSQYLLLTPRSSDNMLRFKIKNGSSAQVMETSQLPAGQWAHVAVTLGSGMAKLYVNGELKAENNSITIKPSDFKPKNNYIGNSNNAADPLFSGKIDDFRIYNNLLNAEEIQAAMNNWITERIEAENMSLSNYTVETNSLASGGKHVKVNTDQTGTAQFTFTEPSGVYDLRSAYYDENDGASSYSLSVNGMVKDSWIADQDLGSAGFASSNLVVRTTEQVALNSGDIITLTGKFQGWEAARIDYLEYKLASSFTESFNEQSTGSAPSGWTLLNDNGTVTVKEVPSASDKSAHINRTSQAVTRTSMARSFSPLSGAVTVEAKVRNDASTPWFCLPYVYDNAGIMAATVAFEKGSIKSNVGGTWTTVQSFTPGTWYNLKLVIDTNTDTYDMYVNGTLKLSNAQLRNPVMNIAKVEFYAADSNTGSVYVDDVKVY